MKICMLCFLSATFAVQVQAFSPSASFSTRNRLTGSLPNQRHNNNIIHTSTSKLNQKNQDEDERTGMSEAFTSLNDLNSLSSLSDEIARPAKSSESSKINVNLDTNTSLEAELNAIEGDLNPDEVQLYTDMYKEMESDSGGEDGIYGDILGELSGEGGKDKSTSASATSTAGKGFGKTASSSSSSPEKPLMDADGIGSITPTDEDQLTAVELSQDTDEFMRKALDEALSDAKSQTKNSKIDNMDSILNDPELMKEINAVFDRANEQLLEGISDIKAEQAQLAQQSDDRRTKALEAEEARLKEAEGSVSRLVEKVKEETLEVERAVAELKKQQDMLGDDPLMQAADLKKAGIVRQSALVGAVLFSFRSVGDLLFVVQGVDVDGHGASAAIQGLIALACGAYLLFA